MFFSLTHSDGTHRVLATRLSIRVWCSLYLCRYSFTTNLFGIHCHRFRLYYYLFPHSIFNVAAFFVNFILYIWASCHNCPKTARKYPRFFLFETKHKLNVFYQYISISRTYSYRHFQSLIFFPLLLVIVVVVDYFQYIFSSFSPSISFRGIVRLLRYISIVLITPAYLIFWKHFSIIDFDWIKYVKCVLVCDE